LRPTCAPRFRPTPATGWSSPSAGQRASSARRRTATPVSGLEVSLWIGEPYWERGYATEAAHALIDQAFSDAAVDALWCANRVANTRARRVIEKCGFQFRGSGMVRLPGRGASPIERFALDRRTWSSLKTWAMGRDTGGAGDAARETAA
jgi:predicted nucleic acid-binding Zn ribbon protein